MTTSFLGSEVSVKIDRPLGSAHPEQGFLFPVNYGYVAGLPAPGGGNLDAYVLGVFEPIEEFTGRCIAVIHRTDDDDDKLVVVPVGRSLSDDQIRVLTEFQERWFDSVIWRASDRETTPDVERVTEFVATALEPAIGRDWSVRAGQLEWTVESTLEHIAAALSKYTLYLASRSQEVITVRVVSSVNASQRQRLDALPSLGRALANVADATPPDVRAFHASGLTDREGYLALGCLESLIHGYDMATGLGLEFDPPTDVVRAVVAWLTPWLDPAWDSLISYTRIENDDDSWRILTVPLAEWDGSIPE